MELYSYNKNPCFRRPNQLGKCINNPHSRYAQIPLISALLFRMSAMYVKLLALLVMDGNGAQNGYKIKHCTSSM